MYYLKLIYICFHKIVWLPDNASKRSSHFINLIYCFTIIIVQLKVMVWWVSNMFCFSYLGFCPVTDFSEEICLKSFGLN